MKNFLPTFRFDRFSLSIAFFSVAILVATLLNIKGCEVPEKKIIRPVKTIQLKQQDNIVSNTYNGLAYASNAAKLSFKTGGTIKSIKVHVGKTVRKGDTIASLDNRRFKLKVNEVKASLTQAKSQYNNAKSSYRRMQKLYVNRETSLSNYENAKTKVDSTKANYIATKNRLEQAQLELSYTTLKAPINGSISKVYVRKSENVNSASPIVTISSSKTMEVHISVPGSFINQIEEDQECDVTFDALPDAVFNAVVTEIGSSSEQSSSFPVSVKIIEHAKDIRPGMSANVSFTFEEGESYEDSYTIPLHALMEDTQGKYVYTVDEIIDGKGKIVRTDVTAGTPRNDKILITSGVEEDMELVTAGLSLIHVGQVVRVKTHR